MLSTFTGKANSAFELRGTVPLSADGSIPRDIDAFLNALPKDPLWTRDFASVATDIKLPIAGKEKTPEVDFTITCRCKGKTP